MLYLLIIPVLRKQTMKMINNQIRLNKQYAIKPANNAREIKQINVPNVLKMPYLLIIPVLSKQTMKMINNQMRLNK